MMATDDAASNSPPASLGREPLTASILSALPAHIALLNRNGTIVVVNPAWEQFARDNGGDGERCGVGTNYLEVCRNARGERSEEAFRVAAGLQAVLDGEAGEFSIEYPCPSDTEERWFLMQATPLQNRTGAVVLHINITSRIQAERALRENEKRYRLMADQANDGFYRLDYDPPIEIDQPEDDLIRQMYERAIIAECNDLYAQQYGHESRADMKGTRLADLHHGASVPENVEAMRVFVRQGFLHRGEETTEFGKDGQTIHLTNNSVGIVKEGRLVSCLGTQTDVTERYQLEQEVVNAAEGERQRIAHDLHDDLGSLLTGIKLQVEAAGATLEKTGHSEAAKLAAISTLVREAITKTRDLARGLRPVGADPEDLVSALQGMTERVASATGMRCDLHSPGPARIGDPIIANHLFRIAQEAVNNAVKHGGGSSIDISLELAGDTIELRVTDDGVGFDRGAITSGGHGLHIMDYRVRAMSGSLGVQRRMEGGTEVTCSVPVRLRSTPNP